MLPASVIERQARIIPEALRPAGTRTHDRSRSGRVHCAKPQASPALRRPRTIGRSQHRRPSFCSRVILPWPSCRRRRRPGEPSAEGADGSPAVIPAASNCQHPTSLACASTAHFARTSIYGHRPQDTDVRPWQEGGHDGLGLQVGRQPSPGRARGRCPRP